MDNNIKHSKKRRTQTIKGVPYVYEDHPYWDSEKKQMRHKRDYIGKIGVNNEFIPNKSYVARQQLEKVMNQKDSSVTTPVARRSYYGATFLLDSIGDSSGIAADLKACFPDDYKKILSVVYYLIMESDSPMYRFPKWATMHHHPFGDNLSSQRISELFASISEDAKMTFFKRQSKRRLEKEYLAYDTTSISSYSELISHVKYGRNKDHDPLPQVNLALVFGEKSMFPVYYRKLPGNVSDIKIVRKLLKDVEFLNIKKLKLVMDGGFYSAENINALYRSHYKFIVSARSNIKFISGILNRSRESIKDFTNYSVDQDIYCVSSMEKWPYEEVNTEGCVVLSDSRRIYVHIYYNGQRAEDEKANFIKALAVAESSLQDDTANNEQKALCCKYFTMKETPIRGLKAEYNEKAIHDHVRNFGYFVLLSNEIKDPKAALDIYRNKDLVEKAFSNLKNRLNMRRTSVSSSENLEGKLFIQFVALIYISYIHKCMKAEHLYKSYSMQTLLDELDIIERFDYEGQRYHCSEITKKQKGLYSSFQVDPPSML
jgi:transposase